MEDDEEIQSHPSGGTGSPVSPRPNGRITVTVAAVPQSQNTLTMALPVQHQQPQPRPAGNSGGGGREDCWSEGATGVLIDAWGERYLELSRGNLKQKHWKDVADVVSSREDYTKIPKTDIQCKNRIDTVKKKYKQEKSKIAAGGGPSKWPFFERLDRLIGPSAKLNLMAGVGRGIGPSGNVPNSDSQRVPMGIPVGVRSVPHFKQQEKLPQQQNPNSNSNSNQQFRKRPPAVDSDEESEPEASPESGDESPPETYERKRPNIQRKLMNFGEGVNPGPGMNKGRDGGERGSGGETKWGNSVRELTGAILKFGEAYEQAESSKLQQLVDMEKQRMKFAKELELQRMQLFMKTQLEPSQLNNNSRRVGNINNHRSNNNATNNNNISDSSG